MYSEEQLKVIHMQDSYTIMYALLAHEIMDSLGDAGESAVREATRRYGADRGRTRREKHRRLGVKINMQSLFSVCSDLPSDPRFRRDRLLLTEEERNSHTLVCPMAQVWEEYHLKEIGRIYCEEFHRACYSEYAFGHTQVNLARTLTEDGDGYCDFHVVLRKANVPKELKAECFAEYDPDYQKPVITEGSADGKSGFASLCIRVYFYMLEVLLERFPDQAEAVMKKALNVWAADTKQRLTEQADSMKLPLTLGFAEEHFPLYTDIGSDPMWEKYDRYGAKQLLKTGFYDLVYPGLPA